MKHVCSYLCLCIILLPISVSAKQDAVSYQSAFVLANKQMANNELDQAEATLRSLKGTTNAQEEIEKWFLLGRIYAAKGDFDTAIQIYTTILNKQPDLSRIRFELALCYMKTERWYRAEHHLRLAMAGKDLPENAKQMMTYYRYVVRQNKRWNVWFNFGAAPDSNANNGNGGQECINTIFGTLCRNLRDPESVVGANLTLGGDYEFILSDHWRWKSDANIYSNTYDKHDYDDLYLSASTGPRYIWSKGDIWLAAVGARRWYGREAYNWSYGAKVDTNYDFTRRLSGGLVLRVLDNRYDQYGTIFDGQTYSAYARTIYSFNARAYGVFKTGITRENTVDSAYSYWQPNIAVGFGVELPYGFHLYAEPSFFWANYDDPQIVVKDGYFSQITERDFIQRYSLSVSNNKFDIWGFVPTLTVSYTKRDSNIWQREYDKTTLEFTMQQRF